jgi:hypothetical protein
LNARNNDSDEYTAVHYCAWDGKTEALSILLKHGALPDIVGNDGRTALHLASANGFTDSVELLLKAGVDIDRPIPNDMNKYYSENGSTAIREALYNQNWDVVDLLIKNVAYLTNLTEPCCQSLEGTNDLFEIIRISNEKGLYPNGNFNETKLNKLEKEIRGDSNQKEDDVDFFELLKRNLNSNTEDLTKAVLGQEDEVEEEEIVEEEENIIEYEQQEDDTLDLDDFDVSEATLRENGIVYIIPESSFTIAPSDPTNPRSLSSPESRANRFIKSICSNTSSSSTPPFPSHSPRVQHTGQ